MKKGLRRVGLAVDGGLNLFESRPYEEGIKTLLSVALQRNRRFESRPYEEGIKTSR